MVMRVVPAFSKNFVRCQGWVGALADPALTGRLSGVKWPKSCIKMSFHRPKLDIKVWGRGLAWPQCPPPPGSACAQDLIKQSQNSITQGIVDKTSSTSLLHTAKW